MLLRRYFSSNPDIRAKFIFDFIAPFYGKMNASLEKNFNYAVRALHQNVSVKGKTVLDIGTGTGAWAANFKKFGAERVVGLDFSPKMIKSAKQNYPETEFLLAHAENLMQFEDNSFDIVTASFVLHGVKEDKRALMLKEMRRVSRKHIVLHDFIGKTPLFIRFLEFMERSDYKYFKQNICNELRTIFSRAEKKMIKYGTGLYFAEK